MTLVPEPRSSHRGVDRVFFRFAADRPRIAVFTFVQRFYRGTAVGCFFVSWTMLSFFLRLSEELRLSFQY